MSTEERAYPDDRVFLIGDGAAGTIRLEARYLFLHCLPDGASASCQFREGERPWMVATLAAEFGTRQFTVRPLHEAREPDQAMTAAQAEAIAGHFGPEASHLFGAIQLDFFRPAPSPGSVPCRPGLVRWQTVSQVHDLLLHLVDQLLEAGVVHDSLPLHGHNDADTSPDPTAASA